MPQPVAMATTRDVVEVDGYAIVCGRESVGLPAAWSTDTLMASYLDLVRRVRGAREIVSVRAGDIDELARVTGLDPCVVRARIDSITRGARC
jgi:hypothetical protein